MEYKNKKIDCLIFLLLIAFYSILAMYLSLNTQGLSFLFLFLVSICGYLSCALCFIFEDKTKYIYFLLLVPYVLVFILTQFQYGMNGFLTWINLILFQYNRVHETGIQLLNTANSNGLQTFILFFTLIQIDVLFAFMHMKNKRMYLFLYILIWTVLLLEINRFNALIFSLAFIILMSLLIYEMTPLTRKWISFLGIISIGISFVLTNVNNQNIQSIKENVLDTVYDVRYGKNVLPSGQLMQANLLSRGNDIRLKVSSTYEKDLYLKAYVGSIYRDNQWFSLTDADYGYENSGMFTWLNKHHFNPSRQVSTYYSLGKEKLKKNKVSISVQTASRDYLYSVSSLEDVSLKSYQTIKDYGLRTKGLFGKNSYSFDELSNDKPYELMTSDTWLSNPTTKKQKEYIQAESVYRQFVYDHYLKIDRDMNALMKDSFWKDYNPAQEDSIYASIQQIRKYFETNTTYEAQMDSVQSKDAIRYFLKESKKGNSAFYASVATLALRSHGIPARYVEGYYVSKDAFDKKDFVAIKGTDSHAWTEVYYDGIGWVPVDFTPGFYDEAVVLQKMVDTPNTVHKTAGVHKNKKNKADEMYSKNQQEKNNVKDAIKHVVNVFGILLGVIALLVLILTFVFVGLEIIKGILIHIWINKYKHAAGKEKVIMLSKLIDLLLQILHISVCLSWNTNAADEYISNHVDTIMPGDYMRVSYLIEKSVYGDFELQEFEMRTIKAFVQCLYKASMQGSKQIQMRTRFAIIKILKQA